MTNTFTAILHKEINLYVAECPEVGTAIQGTTIEEAIKNLQEATEVSLEEFPLKETFHPILTTFEVAIMFCYSFNPQYNASSGWQKASLLRCYAFCHR